MITQIGLVSFVDKSQAVFIPEGDSPPIFRQFEDGIDTRATDKRIDIVPKQILDSLVALAPATPCKTTITAAVSGFDHRFLGGRFERLIGTQGLRNSRTNLSSLPEAAHEGAFLGQDGILIRCGHGSSVFVRRGPKRELVGGWGVLNGDQASGVWFGQQVIDCVTRLHDRTATRPESDFAHEILLRLSRPSSDHLNAPTLLEELFETRLKLGEHAWKRRLYEIGIEAAENCQLASARRQACASCCAQSS